jgi:hypothetical protein
VLRPSRVSATAIQSDKGTLTRGSNDGVLSHTKCACSRATTQPHARCNRVGRFVMRYMRLALWMSTVAAALGVGAPAVQAHDYCAWHGEDVGCTKEDHRALDSCDREPDGHRVRAWYWGSAGQSPGAWDLNGADPGCDRVWTLYWAQAVRACEEVVGCSDWVTDCCSLAAGRSSSTAVRVRGTE